MESKERYGRFVLQSEDARTSAGSFFRAVQLTDKGYDRHVHLFRTELLAPDVAQLIADGLSRGLQVQHAQVVRGFEAGRIDKTAFASYELLEGRSVGALMERSQTEGHPFAADHALLIASKAAAALEAAQAKKQIHGFLIPEFIHVTHDGEVSVRGFGLPPRALRDANDIGVREARFLAPEVDGTPPLDIRADIFSLGAQLFEMLTGSALPRNESTAKSIDTARIPSPGSDGTPIPKALCVVLLQSLVEDPAKRFKDAATFKKAVDTLLFSGDYSPTTFNLAFFMHTLFRDEGDSDTAIIKDERTSDYRSYLAQPNAPVAAPSAFEPRTPATPTAAVSASGLTHATAPPAPSRGSGEFPRPEVARGDSGRIGRLSTPIAPPSIHPATSDTIFQTVSAEKKSPPIVPIVLAVLVVGGLGAYFATRPSTPAVAPPTAQPTMNAAETAALARVKELESRLAALESEKLAAEQKAAEDAKKVIEAQAKARGQAVDPAVLQKAQDDARKKAQADQEARVQAERQKIEEERRKAEETRAAEAAKTVAEATPVAVASATPAPFVPAPPVASTPSPVPPPASAAVSPSVAAAATSPASAAGPAALDLADPTVIPPQLTFQPRLEYPPVARVQRVTGTVVVSALVDEKGDVVEARLIRGVAPNSGLNQAALESVKRRKYKPATQNGKPGRAWVAIQIDFKL